ncbi:MAG: DNA primase [Dehalococcoidia bacterium]|nr:DNA primase [Dehalococcoidia bacterium]
MGAIVTLLDDVKQRLDIVEVVSRTVPLQPAGRNLKARCPFHTERTPSFYVFPETQTWRCFGACATGGDAIGFVMRQEAVPFGEALRRLAREAGVSLPSPRASLQASPLLQVNKEAAQFYHRYLIQAPEAEPVRAYLSKRGITTTSTEAFLLGLSPSQPSLLSEHLVGIGFSAEQGVEAGLLLRSEDGRIRDRFRGRLMFPIADAGGQVVGFSGRVLDGSEPKYTNTPRTPLFDKGSLLYGLHRAVDGIRTSGTVVVVEGYTDVIVPHQAGFTNVVASMGTSLTQQQVGLLEGLAKSCVLALDPDVAGQEATFRSLEGSWRVFQRPQMGYLQRSTVVYTRQNRVALKIAALPEGKDPDEVVLQDPDAWKRIIAEARSLPDFLLEVLPRRYDLAMAEGRRQLAERLGPVIVALEPQDQDRYLTRLEQLVGVDRHTLDQLLGVSRQAMLRQAGVQTRAASRPGAAPFRRALADPLEQYTLSLLFQEPALRDQAGALTPEHFVRAEHREIFTAWQRCATLETVRQSVDPVLAQHVDRLLALPSPVAGPTDRTAEFAECVHRLEERRLRLLKRHEGLDEEGAPVPASLDVNRRLHQLFTEQRGKNRGD